MATAKQLKRLAINPTDYIRFATTGKLPEGMRPSSPLISLLEGLGAANRMRIVGLVVDQRLGYSGSRRFANAEQAYRWIKPSDEVFGSFPAESWRIKRFDKQLTVADLASCGSVPEALMTAPRSRPRLG